LRSDQIDIKMPVIRGLTPLQVKVTDAFDD